MVFEITSLWNRQILEFLHGSIELLAVGAKCDPIRRQSRENAGSGRDSVFRRTLAREVDNLSSGFQKT
jgi:hypothetical protein